MIVPTVDLGLLLVVFCSMDMTGDKPSILSTSGRSKPPKNCLAYAEKVSIYRNHNNCHHHHCAVCAHQDDEWCCTEAEVLIPCFTTFSSQHLTSKLCKHSGPIKLDIIIIMTDDIYVSIEKVQKKKI